MYVPGKFSFALKHKNDGLFYELYLLILLLLSIFQTYNSIDDTAEFMCLTMVSWMSRLASY